jgi:hypothetical protein
MRTLIGLVAAAVLAAGCSGKGGSGGGEEEKATPIPFSEAPADMVKEAQRRMPDVKFDEARKKADGSYEIRGKNKGGKIREVEFHPDGKIDEE